MTEPWKIKALTLVAVLIWAVALPSMACTIMISPPRLGETLEQAVIREERVAQLIAWDQADSVFLARVVETTEISDGRFRYTFEPVAHIHGRPPPSRLSETWFSDACPYPGPQWSRGDMAIVYADQIDLHEYWLRWGQWQERQAVRLTTAYDPRIALALRRFADRSRTPSQ